MSKNDFEQLCGIPIMHARGKRVLFVSFVMFSQFLYFLKKKFFLGIFKTINLKQQLLILLKKILLFFWGKPQINLQQIDTYKNIEISKAFYFHSLKSAKNPRMSQELKIYRNRLVTLKLR